MLGLPLSVAVFSYVLASLNSVVQGVAPVNSIPVKVINHAGAPIEVYWIDTFSNDGTIVKQTSKPLRNSSEAAINSYNGHQFVAKFLHEMEGVEAYFTKGPSEETVLIEFDPETNEMSAKQITKFDEMMDLINEATRNCNDLNDTYFTDCIKLKVVEEANRLTDTTKELKRFRDLMSPRLNQYVCFDDKANVSEPLRTIPFDDRKDRASVDLMVDTDRAKVWVMRNAISAKECEVLTQQARPSVGAGRQAAVATSLDGSAEVVADVDNTSPRFTYNLSTVSPEQDPLWPLYSKVIKVTNAIAKQNLPVLLTPQEGFELSHYSLGDSIGTSFHCAGQCEDPKFTPGGRVASALLFCKVAESGGHLTFPKADIVLTPETGMGVFFSYKSSAGPEMDDGYTETTGCPVRAGGLTVASLHMRSGVPPPSSAFAVAGAAAAAASGGAVLLDTP